MSTLISTIVEWLVDVINVLNAAPMFNVLFLIPVFYLVLFVLKKFME